MKRLFAVMAALLSSRRREPDRRPKGMVPAENFLPRQKRPRAEQNVTPTIGETFRGNGKYTRKSRDTRPPLVRYRREP